MLRISLYLFCVLAQFVDHLSQIFEGLSFKFVVLLVCDQRQDALLLLGVFTGDIPSFVFGQPHVDDVLNDVKLELNNFVRLLGLMNKRYVVAALELLVESTCDVVQIRGPIGKR